MSLVGRIAGGARAQVWPGGDGSAIWGPFFQAASGTGEPVTVERALRLDTVISAVRLLSESVGALPLKVYQRTRGTGGRGRAEAWSDPVYRLLHEEPNPEMTAMDLWSLVITHLNTWGNAYIGKNYEPGRGGRRVAEMWPIKPDLVTIERRDGRKVYEVMDPATGRRERHTDRIIHIRGLSLDGVTGLSPISLARAAIGRGLAEDEFAGAFFRNSAMPRGVLSVQGRLSDGAGEALRRKWESIYRGSGSAHRVAILDEGATFSPVTMPLEDAQFIEQSKMSVQKIARVFRVPASMIGGESGDSLTYRTVEGDAISFERYSLRPWLVRIEQALARDRDLFPGEGRGVYPEFVTDAILRADTKTRYEAYGAALDPERGWMDVDEVRALENLGPRRRAAPSLSDLDRQVAQWIAESDRAREHAHANGNGGGANAG